MGIIPDILFVLLWLAGMVGTFFPVVPATIIIWAAAALHAVLTGFQPITWTYLAMLGLVACVAFFVDNIAAAWGARKFGGSSAAGWGALVGGIGGLFLGPLGFLLGPLLGAVLAELIFKGRTLEEAVKSGFGTLVGMLGGIGAKLVIHAAMGILVMIQIFRA